MLKISVGKEPVKLLARPRMITGSLEFFPINPISVGIVPSILFSVMSKRSVGTSKREYEFRKETRSRRKRDTKPRSLDTYEAFPIVQAL